MVAVLEAAAGDSIVPEARERNIVPEARRKGVVGEAPREGFMSNARREGAVPKSRTKARSGDEEATELWSAHYPRLAGWCRRLVDDADTAHEIAAEAFTRLWARWSRVDDPRGFLYVTATNLVRDHWRKMQRERRGMRQVVALSHVDQHARQADLDLRVLVQGLPDRLRAPVLLHYYAGFPVRDVAFLLDRKEGTVKSDLHDARVRLREALEGER